METLRRKLSVSIKQRTGGERPDNKGREETTTNCNQEFDFVNFDAAESEDSADSVPLDVTNTTLGPYPEGSLVRLQCVATGGSPAPDISWYIGDR